MHATVYIVFNFRFNGGFNAWWQLRVSVINYLQHEIVILLELFFFLKLE